MVQVCGNPVKRYEGGPRADGITPVCLGGGGSSSSSVGRERCRMWRRSRRGMRARTEERKNGGVRETTRVVSLTIHVSHHRAPASDL